MKNFKNYLLTALLAFTLAFGITGITTLTKASAETKLKANLNVGQDISLVISADIPNAGTVTATFAWNGEKGNYSDTVVGEKQGETDTYKFFYRGLSAQYMAKDVTVTVKNGETEVETANVSVKGILNTYLNTSAKALKINANAYKKLTTLSADILNYGKAAEKYLNMADDIGTVTGGTTFVADDTATSNETGNLKWNAGIAFDYNLRPAVKVYIPAETYKDTLVAKIDGNVATLTATPTANVYMLTYSNYNILDLDNDYKVESFDGGTSVGSYTSSLAALAKENNAEIVKAAYVYGKSVVKYASVLEDINFVSEHFQAEDVITGGGNSRTGSNSWQYTVNGGTTINIGSGWIANGTEGKYVENLSSKTSWYAKITVEVPTTGEYDLRGMMQLNNNFVLGNRLKVAVKQSGEEVADSDYIVTNSTDYNFTASQWGADGYATGWKNTYFWTDESIATISLTAGENDVYIAASSASAKDIPNIDYLYIKGYTTKEDSITVVNTRKTFSTSLTEQPVIGATEETAFVIQKGNALRELFKYTTTVAGSTVSGYPNNMTGLYMIIPNFTYKNSCQPFKVPVTEDMISGLNVDEEGIQKATITYKTYSTEVYFNVYESVIEAEKVYKLIDGKAADTKYGKVEGYTSIEYFEEGKSKSTKSSAYNGFSGTGMVTSLGDDKRGENTCFVLKVTVPIAGNYRIKMRAQSSSGQTISVKNNFKVNINGSVDTDGNLSFTTCMGNDSIFAGNRLSEYFSNVADVKKYQTYFNMFWWNKVDLGSYALNEGENEIQIRMNSVRINIDRFEVIYDDTTTSNVTAKTSIFSMRTKGVEESMEGKVLTINKLSELTSVVPVNALHPATYTSLYMRLTSGKEVPILGSMLDGLVNETKIGEEQLVTVTDPVSGESASFKLLITE